MSASARARTRRMRALAALAAALALAALAGIALGQSSGGTFAVTKDTIDGGGGRAAGGSYVVTGTIGQADAGPPTGAMTGGAFRAQGGFWPQTPPPRPDALFADGFENP